MVCLNHEIILTANFPDLWYHIHGNLCRYNFHEMSCLVTGFYLMTKSSARLHDLLGMGEEIFIEAKVDTLLTI